jgi:hypothetical protein
MGEKSRSGARWCAGALLATAAFVGGITAASADENDARALLKAMSDYMGAQQAVSFAYDTSLAVVTSDLQKIEFASSGTVSLARPDKLRITRTGGYADVEVVFDGQQLSILGKNLGKYVQVPAPGTVEQLIDRLRERGIEAPGADLLLENINDALLEPVVDVKDLGSGIIDGEECNHLAFRTESVDWQIWISMGDDPHPCRYVVTSKLMALAPEYRVDVHDWKAGSAVSADDFKFDPGTAEKGELADLRGIDELPDLSGEGGAQ